MKGISPMTTRTICQALVVLLGVALLQGWRYPQDIEGTLEEIENGVMRVGVTESAPWVIRTADGPAGIEVEIITELARELNAEVQWHWGNETNLLDALSRRQLHLVIGGLTQNKRLPVVSAPTNPYYKSRITVGFPQAEAETMPASLAGVTVAIEPLSTLEHRLTEHDAQVVVQAEPERSGLPVAGPTYWLQAKGFEPGPWDLASDRHVMALPKGENAWMLRVQTHLNRLSGLEQRLQRQEEDQ